MNFGVIYATPVVTRHRSVFQFDYVFNIEIYGTELNWDVLFHRYSERIAIPIPIVKCVCLNRYDVNFNFFFFLNKVLF